MKIFFVNGVRAGEELDLALPIINVGREEDNAVMLLTGGVSRYHGELRRDENGGWTVVVHNYRAAMTVRPDGYLGPHFVRPQLDCSIHDAVVIAEIVGHLLGVKHMTCEEFAAR